MNHFSPERAFQTPGRTAGQGGSWFRVGALALGTILALQAVWILIPEIIRPVLPFFPATSGEARATASHYYRAALAAHIGWWRGGLLADNALSLNAPTLGAFLDGHAAQAPNAGSVGYASAETAAALAPADARPWLLLAMASAQTHNYERALAQLKMSYYTAAYSEKLFPLRIQIVAQLPALTDRELQGFLQYELKTIIHNSPSQKPSIVAAYRSATPAARQFLNATLAPLDAKFLTQLRSTGR